MAGQLSRFKIVNLHGIRTIDVSIEDNKLVLVGENGTGKSTVASMIYYFLTRQWNRLGTYEFDEIHAVLDGKEFSVTREFLRFMSKFFDTSVSGRDFPYQMSFFELDSDHHVRMSSVLELLSDRLTPDMSPSERQRTLSLAARRLGISPRHFVELLDSDEEGQFEIMLQHSVTLEEKLLETLDFQILFLPTYRRIEQDLETIFQGHRVHDEIEELTRTWRRSRKHRRIEGGYIELIEFGMSDVDATINNKMESLDRNRRVGLDKLSGSYLRDILHRHYREIDVEGIVNSLDDGTVEAVLGRIPEDVLTQEDKKSLRQAINNLRVSQSKQVEDLVTLLYLVKLLDLHRTQEEDERAVTQFTEVCNAYLSGKRLRYDDLDFKISLVQYSKNNEQTPLKLGMLSSGEKQIVSLFSHIFLSGVKQFFVLIDEPELSLSVPWQKRFLVDILESDRCAGLVAVTHSPFIYENYLDEYTHSIEEFME